MIYPFTEFVRQLIHARVKAKHERYKSLLQKVSGEVVFKEEAEKVLSNCLTNEHIFVLKDLMGQYKDLKARISRLENEMTEKMLPYAHLIEKLGAIPGIDKV